MSSYPVNIPHHHQSTISPDSLVAGSMGANHERFCCTCICQPTKWVACLRWCIESEPQAAQLELQQVQTCCDITDEAYRCGGAHVWDHRQQPCLSDIDDGMSMHSGRTKGRDIYFDTVPDFIPYSKPPPCGPEY